MESNNFKPRGSKFNSGAKFKGRATGGNPNSDRPSSRDSSDSRPPRRDGDAGASRSEGSRPFREDRGAKFNSDSKKVFNRSERFSRPASEEGGSRPSGERPARSFGGDKPRTFGDKPRPFAGDKRPGFKPNPKFDKSAGYKGSSRRSEDKPDFNRENSDRPARTERTERPERGEGGDRERPRYHNREGGESRSSAPREDRRPDSGEKRKTFGTERFRTNERSDRRPDREDKPRFGKRPNANDADSPRERKSYNDRAPRETNSDPDRPVKSARAFESVNPGEETKRPYKSNRPEFTPGKPSGERSDYKSTRTGATDRPDYKANRPTGERPERSERTKEGKRPFSKKSEEVQEAPNYDLKRYQSKERKAETEKDKDGLIRLNRYIANAGICSRREADTLIESGEIKVNGETVVEMGYMVRPEDTVTYGKKRLNREKMVYVLLNKPKDFITTTEDPEGRKTVMDLVATASKERIFPVGRLDRNTTGLLLFTNDGELAQKLTHPSNNISKIYQVELDKPITKEHFEQIVTGIELEDGKAVVDDLAIIGDKGTFLGIQIHIGKNRIVRRIFEHLGYDVIGLDRVQYSGLTKKDIPRGKWRFLNEKEVIRLKYFM